MTLGEINSTSSEQIAPHFTLRHSDLQQIGQHSSYSQCFMKSPKSSTCHSWLVTPEGALA